MTVTLWPQFAEERANLREKGAALDAEIGRCERQISALEATRAVMQAAHQHFMRKITPLAEDSKLATKNLNHSKTLRCHLSGFNAIFCQKIVLLVSPKTNGNEVSLFSF